MNTKSSARRSCRGILERVLIGELKLSADILQTDLSCTEARCQHINPKAKLSYLIIQDSRFLFALQTERFGEASENCRKWIL